MVDANEAVASVAFRTSEVVAIYPITPASPMGEHADAWSAKGQRNLWGDVPDVLEMQSEGGAAGTVHGALQGGAMTTTFTASQGLLLMLPNLYKIAGELTPMCLHVAARTVATHALSIFGDHSDVMAARQTGFALLCSNNGQEAHDMALVGLAASLRSRIPFLHFFDGFRTSHEISKVEELTDDDLRALLDEELVEAHRLRGLDPERPVLRGTAQNFDAFFQAREAINPYYEACPKIVDQVFEAFAERTGRRYHPFEYVGHPEAERVVVLMGSGAETAQETVEHLADKGERVGAVKVRLYRPFSVDHLLAVLPATVRAMAVLDRTKEPGAVGDPLFLDVVAALQRAQADGRATFERAPTIVGGRYGLSSKEFDPACVKAVLDELSKDQPRHGFTVGITDDVSHTSLEVDREFNIEPNDVVRALFYGLGSDGTVGANKNSIKIIGEEEGRYAQGYFVYDSKKSGAVTISHLRFGPRPIRSTYLVEKASFVACHRLDLLDRFDVLGHACEGATFLLNCSGGAAEAWSRLPREAQQQIIEKKLEVWAIDAHAVAKEAGLGVRINTIMQTCFFQLSGVLPQEEAIARIKHAVEKTYGKRGPVVVRQNFAAVDEALAHLERVEVPAEVTSERSRPPVVSDAAPDFVKKVEAVMLAGKGDLLPVSAFPVDGTFPTATSKWEKRSIAHQIPLWEPDLCIQCNQCAFVCPHAAIRAKAWSDDGTSAPEGFLSLGSKNPDLSKDLRFSIQVAPDDCTGCHLCVEMCPAKDKANPRRKAINMADKEPVLEREREHYDFFLDLPEVDRTQLKRLDARGTQLLQPLFEYSGACAGCGETPYIKLLTQLFGDRALIANATGCSSIYGGNLPTTPYAINADGRGPAWSNSLFEDNAEFGLGFRLSLDVREKKARRLLSELHDVVGDALVRELLDAELTDLASVEEQRTRVAELRARLERSDAPAAKNLSAIADVLVDRSVWLVGGDGWAYDIGYGGLDHVLGVGRNVNVLVLDTEAYSNTGGQASKATPLGASAKFASSGKEIPKKDLGLEAMSYGHVYVARVAMGAKVNQTAKAFAEAASYPGPSLIIAYSHCIAHGYDLRYGLTQQKKAVTSGVWPLYRFDPRRTAEGKAPLQLDAGAPTTKVADYMRGETRFLMVERQDPARFKRFLRQAQDQAEQRHALYQQLAGVSLPVIDDDDPTDSGDGDSADAAE
jgi:pyruvate-ferredoxin/flavodoxin oxidoreductase